jgi:hypothetical protein
MFIFYNGIMGIVSITIELKNNHDPIASGGDKRHRMLAVSALSLSTPVDKMPAYCEKKRLISLPTPDTHETQLSNCSHTNLSKNCYVFALSFLFLWGDKYKKIFQK